MKVLIWFSCIFVATIANALLGYVTGFKVGYLIFYLVVSFIAKRLCNKWDDRKEEKEETQAENNNKTAHVIKGPVELEWDNIEKKYVINDNNPSSFDMNEEIENSKKQKESVCGEYKKDTRLCCECGKEITHTGDYCIFCGAKVVEKICSEPLNNLTQNNSEKPKKEHPKMDKRKTVSIKNTIIATVFILFSFVPAIIVSYFRCHYLSGLLTSFGVRLSIESTNTEIAMMIFFAITLAIIGLVLLRTNMINRIQLVLASLVNFVLSIFACGQISALFYEISTLEYIKPELAQSIASQYFFVSIAGYLLAILLDLLIKKAVIKTNAEE